MKPYILGLGGSVSSTSTSRRALDLALAGAAEAGAEVAVLDLASLDLPLFRPSVLVSAPVQQLIDGVRQADGMLWSSPLYHGSVSAQFKNAIDWLELLAGDPEPYLYNRVVGLIVTAGGSQAFPAIEAMQSMVRALRGWTAPRVIALNHASQALAAESPDARVLDNLRLLGAEVATAALRLHPRA